MSHNADAKCARTHPCRAVEDSKTDPGFVHASFVRFMKDYEKEYATVEELAHRLTVFAQNLREVVEHDAKAAGYEIGITKFSDWTKEEFKAYFCRADLPKTGRGAAAAVTWIFRGDESRRRRGWDVGILRRRRRRGRDAS